LAAAPFLSSFIRLFVPKISSKFPLNKGAVAEKVVAGDEAATAPRRYFAADWVGPPYRASATAAFWKLFHIHFSGCRPPSMPEVSAKVSASVDKMVISHFMRDFTAQTREDATFLHSLSAEEKAVFERAGQETRKQALIGAVAAPGLLWAAKRVFLQFAGNKLPTTVKSGGFTMKVLNVTAYIAASAIGGFQQAQTVVPANIERLVALPPPSTIGARARASVALVQKQAETHVSQDLQGQFQLAIARYTRFFPAGLTGEELALKGAANPFLAAEEFRDRVLKKTPSTSQPDDAMPTTMSSSSSSSSSSRKEQPKPIDEAIADQRSSRYAPSDPQPSPPPTPADRPRRRSSYDTPRGRDALPEGKSAEVKPAGRVVYNKWGDIVTPDDSKSL
jgi:hypothetical protein